MAKAYKSKYLVQVIHAIESLDNDKGSTVKEVVRFLKRSEDDCNEDAIEEAMTDATEMGILVRSRCRYNINNEDEDDEEEESENDEDQSKASDDEDGKDDGEHDDDESQSNANDDEDSEDNRLCHVYQGLQGAALRDRCRMPKKFKPSLPPYKRPPSLSTLSSKSGHSMKSCSSQPDKANKKMDLRNKKEKREGKNPNLPDNIPAKKHDDEKKTDGKGDTTEAESVERKASNEKKVIVIVTKKKKKVEKVQEKVKQNDEKEKEDEEKEEKVQEKEKEDDEREEKVQEKEKEDDEKEEKEAERSYEDILYT